MEEYLKRLVSEPLLGKLIIVILGIIVITIIISLIKKTLNRYVKEKSSWYKTRKAVNILGYFLATIFVLITYSDKLGGVTVVIGVAGAGLAFALQEIIISIAGWSAILVSDIFKTGDRVLLGGIKGDVIDQGILRTTIMEIGQWVDGDLYNGRIVRISNSFIFKEPVYNYSADFPFLWDEIKIPIKYGSNYKKAKEIINEVAQEVVGDYSKEAQAYWEVMVRKFLIEDASTQPMITIKSNDNWIEYTLRYVVDYKKRRSTKDMIFTRILEELENRANDIELASSTFQLVGMPSVDVNIKNE